MKNVVVLSHSPYVGGGELALKSLIESTSESYNWTLVVPSKTLIDEKVRPNNVRVVQIPGLPWWCYESHDKPQLIDQKRLIKSLDMLRNIAGSADILVTNTITIPWLGLLAQELSKPHIWYVHEFGDIDHNLQFIGGYGESLEIIDRCSSRVLTISNAVKNHLSQVISLDKIDIIHQSIDLVDLLSISPVTPSPPRRLLCLGAIKPSKGQMIALEAASGLKNIQLDIIGPAASPEYAAELQGKAETLDNVNVEIRSYSPFDELSSHDILLMCSQNEGLGRVTLEAMAAGRIVVGYASPSTEELLSESRGILYSPNNSDALRKVLLSLQEKVFTIDARTGRRYVLSEFNDSAQANDFYASVDRSLDSKPENSNELSKYMNVLNENELWLSKSQQRIQFLKSFIPSPLRRALKRIVRIF